MGGFGSETELDHFLKALSLVESDEQYAGFIYEHDDSNHTIGVALWIKDNRVYGYLHEPMEIPGSSKEVMDVELTDSGASLSESDFEQKTKKRKLNKKTEGKVSSIELRKSERLPDFLLRVLGDPGHYGSIIRWQNEKEGYFKVGDSRGLAKVWGDQRKKPEMDFEKLSRAMRYFYKQGVLESVKGRLVYRFAVDEQGLGGCPRIAPVARKAEN